MLLFLLSIWNLKMLFLACTPAKVIYEHVEIPQIRGCHHQTSRCHIVLPIYTILLKFGAAILNIATYNLGEMCPLIVDPLFNCSNRTFNFKNM